MKVINTAKLNPKDLKAWERDCVYNGLDACVTHEVFQVLKPKLTPVTSKTYEFSKALQGPVLEMRLRGVKVDLARRAEVIEHYYNLLDQMERNLERIVREGADFVGFNWRSPPDLRRLFYDIFQIPEIRTKEGRPTVNRTALEKMEVYTIAYPIIQLMKEMRDIAKRISVVKAGVDPDGYIRTSYNIAGTTTGRFSSSFSEFGTGGNLQNIEEFLRSMFIADDGMKMANFDAEQGESRVVGAIEWNLFKLGAYLDACESGDLHTYVARLCWPGLPWTNGMDQDREIAERPYYRHYSYRFMCKKLGHGSNYGGRPETLSSQTKTNIKVIRDFQPKYMKAFPAHNYWHNWVEEQIRAHQRLINLTGRQRIFFGRPDSADVVREAIAYDPQGSLSDIVKRGMLNVWRANIIQLLMENHDSILVQYPQEKEDEIIPKVLHLLNHELPLKHGRSLMIPYGCKTGWNWGEFDDKKNPGGLKSYKPGDKRSRPEAIHILDRRVH
jgi:DNA polymerase I-like protein with 3'-5' exonuclease and polymerase domains